MTRDNIIRMAREAGIDDPESDWMYWKAMERFAALVAAAERKACLAVCDNYDISDDVSVCDTAEGIYAAIRERGQQ